MPRRSGRAGRRARAPGEVRRACGRSRRCRVRRRAGGASRSLEGACASHIPWCCSGLAGRQESASTFGRARPARPGAAPPHVPPVRSTVTRLPPAPCGKPGAGFPGPCRVTRKAAACAIQSGGQPMSTKVSDHILERLREWGVDHVFGYPGDGINGLLAAWGRADNQPRFVQSRHEGMSAFEAVGYAKFSGRIGVCAATSGPGAIHLLNGLYDAKLDHVPVLAIVGQTHRTAMGGSYQQEVDLLALFKDVCSDYVQMCTVPEQLPNLIDRPIRIATVERAPTALIFPSDVLDLPYEPPKHAFKQVPSSLGLGRTTPVPSDDDVRKAAEILNAGEKVALLVGQGAAGCVEELSEVADLLGAGAAKALLGKDVLPDTLPWVTGSIGLLGTTASYELMMNCDTLLTVGSNFPYTQFLPELNQARAVQIDRDAKWIGMRYPYEINLVGDAGATLRALIPLLEHKADRSWREKVESDVADWKETAQRRAMTGADPVNPMRIVHELSER